MQRWVIKMLQNYEKLNHTQKTIKKLGDKICKKIEESLNGFSEYPISWFYTQNQNLIFKIENLRETLNEFHLEKPIIAWLIYNSKW